ncbi:hypothetical protein Bxe_A3416 [Paraburkholderia xenovorans LB400]|uniref:Uncharacterized protein n=1 Tax=Paraburkholderia xenovorans (strain LB400) TaxID=266265 RepID=Q143C0_PARXL|nr:hypothetical protein Bxe_A3416 [Paraburkholderia xenovorans LB400]
MRLQTHRLRQTCLVFEVWQPCKQKGELVIGFAFCFCAAPVRMEHAAHKKKPARSGQNERLPPMPLEKGHQSVGVFWPHTNPAIFQPITGTRPQTAGECQLLPGSFRLRSS